MIERNFQLEAQAVQVYLAEGVKAAAMLGYSREQIVRIVSKHGYEPNCQGRKSVPLSFREAALQMFVQETGPKRITQGSHKLMAHSSLRRMVHMTVHDETLHNAVGLLITHPSNGDVLIHNEQYSNPNVGKFSGNRSIQLSWRGKDETQSDVVKRILQREVNFDLSFFTNNILDYLEPASDHPAANIRVADVMVSVYRFVATDALIALEPKSHKVTNIHWANRDELRDSLPEFRSGARETLELLLNLRQSQPVINSDLNSNCKAFMSKRR